MKLSLTIERLVLDGVAATPAEAARIRSAVEGELHRLFVAEPVPQRLRSGSAVASLPAATVNLATRAVPEAVGRQIARAVHGGLAGPRGGES
jgi:hypothetical protein